MLSIPSLIIGWYLAPIMVGSGATFWKDSIFISSKNLANYQLLMSDFKDSSHVVTHAVYLPSFWLSLSSFLVTFYVYLCKPNFVNYVTNRLSMLYGICVSKFGFDTFYKKFVINSFKKYHPLFISL